MSGHDPMNVAAVPLARRSTAPQPRLLVCHDMMGGYVQDSRPQGEPGSSHFRLYHWHIIDRFVYFSHHFVTIPPSVWTNAAHRNGVPVLGTLITEWDEGAAKCRRLLSSREVWQPFADQLVNITVSQHTVNNAVDPCSPWV